MAQIFPVYTVVKFQRLLVILCHNRTHCINLVRRRSVKNLPESRGYEDNTAVFLPQDYRSEVSDILASDRQLAEEIEFDLKRYEEDQKKLAREQTPTLSVTPHAQMVYCMYSRISLRSSNSQGTKRKVKLTIYAISNYIQASRDLKHCLS